jgi:hypothetical protein
MPHIVSFKGMFGGDNPSEKTNICLVNFLRYHALGTNEFTLKKMCARFNLDSCLQ